MNKEQDKFPFLGIFGILKESIKLILTWPKIFMLITLVSIVPQSCMLFLVGNLHSLTNLVFFIFSTIFTMISISTVVYTIACIYTNQEITFKKVMSVVPKVWKPYMITQIFKYYVISGCSSISGLVLFIFRRKPVLFTGFLFLVIVGVFYTSIIWQLSEVISVMEENCGIKALKKSRGLIKGKTGTALAIFLVAFLCISPIIALKFYELTGGDGIGGVAEELCFKVLGVVWWTVVSLLLLVIQSVFYFVCKSYHHEDIDIFSFSDHLGEYAPLKASLVKTEPTLVVCVQDN